MVLSFLSIRQNPKMGLPKFASYQTAN